MVNRIKNSEGFSLIEIMISIAIFATFITVFVSGQSFNLLDSVNFKKELNLAFLCEMKMNEIIVSPPDFQETLLEEAEPQTKEFENYPGYAYSIRMKKFSTEQFESIIYSNNEEQDNNSTGLQQFISLIKENLEKMLWQIEIKVTHKKTNESYSLTRWNFFKEE